MKYLKQACEAELPDGCANLGYEYVSNDGVKPDLRAAKKWLREACELGRNDLCFIVDVLK